MALNWKRNNYFSLLIHGDKRSHVALEMLVDDLHAEKESTISTFLSHSGSEDFLWGLVRLLGNGSSRVAGNAAYILGTLAESEFGCLRVISLTSNRSGEKSKILTDLTNMLTFDDSESVMNAAGTLGTLAESHEGRQWMLKEECLLTTLKCVTDLLSSSNLWTASNAALVLARLTIAEEGCEQLLVHVDSSDILTKLTASLGVDEAGRGMNAAFAIGRLCDMETGRKRLLGLPDSEKMIIALAKMLCCNDAGASKNACFALSCLATNKEGHTRILKNSRSDEVLRTLTELLSADDAETGWFAAMMLRTLASQPMGCLRLRSNPFILPALQSVEKRDDLGEDLKEEVTQTLGILKLLERPQCLSLEETEEGINVSWEEVTTKSGFEVRYELFESEKKIYEGKKMTYIARAVRPFTQYSFKVRANTEGDESPFSEIATIITDESVPGPPQNVRILGCTTTLLKVGWDPPLETNGQLKGYCVYNGKNLVEHTAEFISIISGLTPKTNYEISVCASTSKGRGSKEYTLGCTSDSGAHCPSRPEILVRGRSELHVSWKPPEVPLGKLSRYELSMNGEVIYSGTDLHYTVLRLRPDTEYTFTISSMTTEGKFESKPTKKRTAKDEYEGERAPLYQPPLPKKEVQVEEAVREEVERKSAGPSITKKRKSIAASTHGESSSSKTRSASASGKRRNSQSKEVEANKKGGNSTFKDIVDIRVVDTPVSGVVYTNKLSTGVNSSYDVSVSSSNLTPSNSSHKSVWHKPTNSVIANMNGSVAVPGGSSLIKLPYGDGPLVATRYSAQVVRPSVAVVFDPQDDSADQHGRRDSLPKAASDERGDVSHVFAWENSLRSYTQIEMLQKSRGTSSRTRRSEIRGDPDLPLYRSATMLPKEPAPSALRQDFPKPKPPSLKPAFGPGRITKSLEYSSDGNYKTSSIAARQSGQTKSSRIRAIQNPETVVSDFHKSRRVRSNTWAFDHAPSSRREVTLLELKNGSDGSLAGRSYRVNSDSGIENQRVQKADRLRASFDETRTSESLKRPTVGRRYVDHHMPNNPTSSGTSSIPINPQWKVDLPCAHAAQNHGKFVPMQFRTQPANIPGGMHRQATNLQLYDRGLKVNFIARSKTDLGAVRQISRSAGLPLPGSGTDSTSSSSEHGRTVPKSNIGNSASPTVQLSALPPFIIPDQKSRNNTSKLESRSPRHQPRQSSGSLVGQLAFDPPANTESKLQRAS